MSETENQPTQEATMLYRFIWSYSILIVVGQFFAIIVGAFDPSGHRWWETQSKPLLYLTGLPFCTYALLDVFYYFIHGTKYEKSKRDDLESLYMFQFWSLFLSALFLGFVKKIVLEGG